MITAYLLHGEADKKEGTEVQVQDLMLKWNPKQLRMVAEFLMVAARWLEAPEPRQEGWHQHMRHYFMQQFDDHFSDVDIIVCDPDQ
ncbi:MAG: hypothetical protein KDB90_12135 [Planctomycetes bacterium]|nr:hypothetical protein [Planctomycetota bacterium]